MNHQKTCSIFLTPALGYALAMSVVFASACAGDKKDVKSSDDTFVPQETQNRSQKNYGQQQMMMEDLSMSTSERAGQRHDQRVREMRDPDDEESSGK